MADTGTLSKSRIVKVEFELALPISASYEQVDEWVRYETGGGSISTENPLIDHEIECIRPPTLTDSGFHLHENVTRNDDGSWTVRQWREGSPFEGQTVDEIIAASAREEANHG